MVEKITPRVDLAFKKIFGVEENKDLLISLINSIVSQEDQVSGVEILNPYNPRQFKDDKLSILDIKARGHTGKRYNIEIQLSDEADYDKRALYYWAKLYSEQLTKTGRYRSLDKAIGIHILNFTSIPSVGKYHNVFHLLEKDTGLHYFKDIELHTIELNKFDTLPDGLGDAEELRLLLLKIKTSLDRWAAFLSRCYLLQANNLPEQLDDPSLKKALGVLEEMNFTQSEREEYETRLKWFRMETSALEKAEEKSFQKGIEEGRITMAKALLQDGVDLTVIARASGLSIEELERLQSST